MLRPALAVSFVLFLVPVGSAQQPSTEPPAEFVVTDKDELPNGRLVPETGAARVRLALSVGCGVPPSMKDSLVRFEATSAAPYASPVVFPAEAQYKLSAERCVQENYREIIEVDVVVTTTRDAPAMSTFPTTVAATIEDENGKYGPYEADFVLTNDFIPLTVLNPAQLFVKAEPGQKVVFPVELQNLGNGPSLVIPEASQPNKNKLPAVNVGTPIHLDSRAVSGRNAIFKHVTNVEAMTPASDGYMNSIYQFNVRFVSTYDGEASGVLAQDEQTISFAVQVQGGFVGGAPGVSPLLLLASLAILAIVLRRRP